MSWTLFFVVVAGFLIALVGIVSVPWWRIRNQTQVDKLRNAQVVKQRLDELEREASEGLISDRDKQNAITELKLALVEESTASAASNDTQSVVALTVGLVLAVSTGAIVYYNGNHLSEVQQVVKATESVKALSAKLVGVVEGQSDITPEELQSLTLAIRHRLRETPEDVQAWLNLGRLYMSIGFSEQAIAAFKRAFELAPDDPSMRLNYAQALMLSGTDENLQRAARMLTFELEQQPENDNITLMLTVVMTKIGDLDNAERYFALIKNKLSQDTPIYQTLTTRIQALRQQQGVEYTAADKSQTGFSITVEIIDALISKLPETGFLFVFAQDAVSNMKVPAAVIKLPLQTLPLTVTLTQQNAMMPTFTLDQLQQASLIARVSADENVELTAGELQGAAQENVLTGQMVSTTIVIDQQIK
jgi:cytochrome c-type biogenesis protein CcmI